MTTSLITAEKISISYGDDVLFRDLSISLDESEFIGLVGPNGAGKTTLLSALSGQFRPESGTVCHRDGDIYTANTAFKAKTGYVHENPFFYDYLTVEDTLRFTGKIKGIGRKLLELQIADILELTEMQNERYSFVSQLSMGMKKKLAIGAAFLGNPEIVFLDEAFVNIDFTALHKIKKHLGSFTNNSGTVILSTHILETVEKLCSRIVFLSDGCIVKDISSAELRTQLTEEHPDLESLLVSLRNQNEVNPGLPH